MNIEKEIIEIKERNRRVEADKAWETSVFRIITISLMTFAFTALLFYVLGVSKYLTSALIPTLGFFISTQTLPFIKKWWISKRFKG
jgi:hypothetical protein